MTSKNWIRLGSFDYGSVVRSTQRVPKTLKIPLLMRIPTILRCDVSLGQQPSLSGANCTSQLVL